MNKNKNELQLKGIKAIEEAYINKDANSLLLILKKGKEKYNDLLIKHLNNIIINIKNKNNLLKEDPTRISKKNVIKFDFTAKKQKVLDNVVNKLLNKYKQSELLYMTDKLYDELSVMK